MEKSTDSSSSPTSSSSNFEVSTTAASTSSAESTSSNKTNQQDQILHNNRFKNSASNLVTNTETFTLTKNCLSNSQGCGPSSIGITAVSSPCNVGDWNNESAAGNLRTSTDSTKSDAATSNNTIFDSEVLASKNTTTSSFTKINLDISTTTGGNFTVSVYPQITVENLKKIIAKKIKVGKDRICLLHREKELQGGLLKEYNLIDGSKIILIPNVETGLLTQRPENTVMQALESLNDAQVNDFLTGKTPLNLNMRLGDHMMLIQLQLSTIHSVNRITYNGSNISRSSSRQRFSHHRSSRNSSLVAASTQATEVLTTTTNPKTHPSIKSSITPVAEPTLEPVALSIRKSFQTPRNSINTSILAYTKNLNEDTLLSKCDHERLQNIVKSNKISQPSHSEEQPITTTNNDVLSSAVESFSMALPSPSTSSVPVMASPSFHNLLEPVLFEQSPIKSLSNLVSSPRKSTAIQNIPKISNNNSRLFSNNSVSLGPHTSSFSAVPISNLNDSVAGNKTIMCKDPIAAKLTSCLCTRLNGSNLGAVSNISHGSVKQCVDTACLSQALHTNQQNQLQAQTTRPSTNTILNSTPNYKNTLIPDFVTTALNNAKTSSLTSSNLHKTAHNPILRKLRRHHHHHYNHTAEIQEQFSTPSNQEVIANTATNESSFNSDDDFSINSSTAKSLLSSSSSTLSLFNSLTTNDTVPLDLDDSVNVRDSRSLAEASRNLTQTLRKLSKEVFTNKMYSPANHEIPRKSGSGATFEYMKNHGKGIYSGTFSGTLNPALQDRYGRPKRDISTVIHILNDLLSVTPQCHRDARIKFETPFKSTTTIGSSSDIVHQSSKSKHMSSKQLQISHHCVKCIKEQNSLTSANNPKSSSTLNASYSTKNGSYILSPACTHGECNNYYESNKSQSSKSCLCFKKCHASAVTSAEMPDSSAFPTEQQQVGSLRHSSSMSKGHYHYQYHQHLESGECKCDYTCQKCTAELDNIKTKSKLDQLRLVMQQRKQKREARKLKRAPYDPKVVGITTTASAATDDNTASTASNITIVKPRNIATGSTTHNEVSQNHLVEEVDTLA